MSLPKEPRQKMINMMYLVLTAMLALNVSAEILNAFKTVKSSLDRSTTMVEEKNAQVFASFRDKLNEPENAENAKIWLPKAEQAKKLADEAVKAIEQYKMELMKEAGYNPPKDTAFKIDDLDAATRLFVEQKKQGPVLLKKLEDFKKQLLAIDTSINTEFGKTLPLDLGIPVTQSKEIKTWEGAYFHMTPAIAALTILSKFQNDIRNSEAQVVEYCHKKVGEVKIKYDKFEVIATSSSSYVLPGEELTVYAGLASFSSTAQPTVTVDGQSATSDPANPGGPLQVKSTVSGSGEQVKHVTVSYTNPNTGKSETVTRDVKYTVGQPAGLTVSTDKTRVFYAGGVENELSVTGSGGAETVDLNVQGTGIEVINKGNGLYIVKCSQPGSAVVVATDKKNNKKQEFKIPIKRIPDPVATVNGKQGGDISKASFVASAGVAARMPDFIFGDYKWTVTGFRIYFTGPGFEEKSETVEVNSNAFNSDVRKFMSRVESGTAVIIDEIKIQDVLGARRTLESSATFVIE